MPMNARLLRPLATGFNPKQISGLALWLDAADSTTLFQNSDGTTPATSANDPVGYWGDKSGNGRHATQATAGNRPAYAGSMNGRGVLTFDGTTDRLLGSVPAITALPATIIAVARPTAGVTDRYLSPLFGQKSGANYTAVLYRGFNAVALGGWLDNLRLYNGGAGNLSSLTPWPTNTAAVVGTLIASPAASQRIYYQGLETPLAEGTNADTPAGSYYIGADPDNTSAAAFWTGQYAEIVVYARALTTAERQRVEGYLAWKWGLQAQLPYDHPYAKSFPGFGSQTTPTDSDTLTYLAAVKAADGTGVEVSVANAVDDFVKGCKSDGIWDAIKASCILAGARTLAGALVPLRGAAPTNTNFVSGDYNRKTGLKGGDSAAGKVLNSNRNNNADPQNSKHVSIYVSEATTIFNFGRFIAAGDSMQGDTTLVTNNTNLSQYVVNLNNSGNTTIAAAHTTGFLGINRSEAASFVFRQQSSEATGSVSSTTPRNENIHFFLRPGESPLRPVNARIAFYSIGESLTLSSLQSRVDTLYAAIGAAI